MCEKCDGALRDGHGPLYAILTSYLKDLDSEAHAKEELEMKEMYDLFQRAVVESLEGFSHPIAKKVHDIWTKHPSFWKAMIEDWYVREGLERVPAVAERFHRLSPVLVGKNPNPEVNDYLREATRCFLYGFFQATASLSRAALEVGLNDYLLRKLGSVPEIGLSEKIKQGTRFSLLTPPVAGMAMEVIKAAGMVLHRQLAPESLAFDTLVRTRGVLRELYAH